MHQELCFQKLSQNATLPTRGSVHAAGLDLSAAENITIPAKKYMPVKTGLAVAIPENFYGRIAPRSGLAAKYGIDTLAGVIDSDYRGEILVLLMNNSENDFEVKIGDRIAQLIIEAIALPAAVWTEDLNSTSRGQGGFGSTGI